MPAPFKAGDLVTIRLTEADAYELGCGAEAKPIIAVSSVVKHEPAPLPYKRFHVAFKNNKEHYRYGTEREARQNMNTSVYAIYCVTIDESKPPLLGEGIVVEALTM